MAETETARRAQGGEGHAAGVGDRVVRRVLLRSCANRYTLMSSGAVAAGGLVFQSPALFLVAVGGYVAAVALDLGRPARWRNAADELRQERTALPSTCRYDDPVTRELLLRIERARTARDAALDRLSAGDQEQLRSLLAQATSLEELGVQLLDAFDRVTRYLGLDPFTPLGAERQRLEHLVAGSTDPEIRREYERAHAAVAQRLRSLEHLNRWRGMLAGKLEALTSVLDALPATIVETELRRSSAGLLAVDLPVDLVSEELRALHDAGIAMLEPPPPASPG